MHGQQKGCDTAKIKHHVSVLSKHCARVSRSWHPCSRSCMFAVVVLVQSLAWRSPRPPQHLPYLVGSLHTHKLWSLCGRLDTSLLSIPQRHPQPPGVLVFIPIHPFGSMATLGYVKMPKSHVNICGNFRGLTIGLDFRLTSQGRSRQSSAGLNASRCLISAKITLSVSSLWGACAQRVLNRVSLLLQKGLIYGTCLMHKITVYFAASHWCNAC